MIITFARSTRHWYDSLASAHESLGWFLLMGVELSNMSQHGLWLVIPFPNFQIRRYSSGLRGLSCDFH